MKLLKKVLRGIWSISKMAWDWIGEGLKRAIKNEYHYGVGLSLLIFLAMFLFMVEMSKHDYDQLYSRQNHLELRMNSYDKNIQETLIP